MTRTFALAVLASLGCLPQADLPEPPVAVVGGEAWSVTEAIDRIITHEAALAEDMLQSRGYLYADPDFLEQRLEDYLNDEALYLQALDEGFSQQDDVGRTARQRRRLNEDLIHTIAGELAYALEAGEKADLRPLRQQMRLRMILVQATKPEHYRELAERVHQQAAAGEDFGQLAMRYSNDDGSRFLQGRTGWLYSDDLPSEWLPVLESTSEADLEANQGVYPLVEQPFGYDVLKRLASQRQPEPRWSLQRILIPKGLPLDEAEVDRRVDNLNVIQARLNEGADFTEVAEAYTDHMPSRDLGGAVGADYVRSLQDRDLPWLTYDAVWEQLRGLELDPYTISLREPSQPAFSYEGFVIVQLVARRDLRNFEGLAHIPTVRMAQSREAALTIRRLRDETLGQLEFTPSDAWSSDELMLSGTELGTTADGDTLTFGQLILNGDLPEGSERVEALDAYFILEAMAQRADAMAGEPRYETYRQLIEASQQRRSILAGFRPLMRARIAKTVAQPSDADILAHYESNQDEYVERRVVPLSEAEALRRLCNELGECDRDRGLTMIAERPGRFMRAETKPRPLEEVREKIRQKLMDERVDAAMKQEIARLRSEHQIQLRYDFFSALSEP